MNYWERRQRELNEQAEKEEEKLKKRLSSYFDAEYARLDRDIAAYYQKYGMDNVIQYRQLLLSLSDDDRQLLIEQIDEFVKKYPQYAELVPVRESIYKLNRLEGLQYSVRMQQLEIGAVEISELQDHLSRLAVRNANAVAETMGFGKNFYSVDSALVQTVVNAQWCNGRDFSERIWGNAEKLAQYLSTDLAQGFARGDSYERLTRQIRQRFGKVSRNDAYRLIYTEGTFVMNEARAASFEQDTEEYIFRVQYDAIRRNGWRDICDDLDGQIFRWDERIAGANFPPMHPWCHCTATPYVSDWGAWTDQYIQRHGGDQAEAEKIAKRLHSESRQGIILPRYQEAVIPQEKFTGYALNPERDIHKARAFQEALGYTQENVEDLIRQIREKLPEYEAKEKPDKGWGKRYEVRMDITGPNGKTAKVLTAWIDDKNNGEIRLTSVYVDRE